MAKTADHIGMRANTMDAAFGRRLAAGAIATLLGVFLLLATGFAHSELLHDAAHDTRHGFTFPCH
ncbi:MAG: CbtB-domain containing protein [Alphaproteobacteria bacterium]|nr:CbtB-domain containing protein [Alphaproteobacteria bacterium]